MNSAFDVDLAIFSAITEMLLDNVVSFCFRSLKLKG